MSKFEVYKEEMKHQHEVEKEEMMSRFRAEKEHVERDLVNIQRKRDEQLRLTEHLKQEVRHCFYNRLF